MEQIIKITPKFSIDDSVFFLKNGAIATGEVKEIKCEILFNEKGMGQTEYTYQLKQPPYFDSSFANKAESDLLAKEDAADCIREYYLDKFYKE